MAITSQPAKAHAPLSSSSYILQCPPVMRYSDVPFRFKATRFTSTAPANRVTGASTLNLLLTCAISGNAEWWVPFLRRLFEAQRDSLVRIGTAWVVEAPNHGDGAVLNEVLLTSQYKEVFPVAQYGVAIKALFKSPNMLPGDRTNLVALSHSAGAAALMFALTTSDLRSQFSSIFVIEGTEIPPDYLGHLAHHVSVYKTYNAGRPARWASLGEGVRFLSTHAPWKSFHPEAFDLLCRTYFRTTESGDVVTKTPLEQESATWADFESTPEFVRRLEAATSVIPVYILIGGVRKFWSRDLEKALALEHQKLQRQGATLISIDGAGHYIPQEKPDELSRAILDILVQMPIASRAML
ncbi:hypothetical protein FA95DRAFT_930111 [Auriscalpium vulgare]|uniref:Uncharacterized protein n=1 Tax=Auriscalpium vulgare TaxID=40419 RepID=A0ACB8R7M7_9AGAM|nr:hypothetical protein FA95DRAFT_930111 [Auriscalpium vulgare]